MQRAHTEKRIDLLHSSLWDKIPLYALPIAATAILEQLFNASDLAVVGNFAHADRTIAVAAIGANSSIIALILNLFIGIALGANVVIANAIGRQDRETVHKAVHTSIVFSVLCGVLVALLGELVAEPLLELLRVPADVLPSALLYLRIYLLGLPVIFLYNFEAAIFRSIGATRTPLKALATAGILNVLLNLFFVLTLNMTVNGVAIATVLSNAVSSVILFRKLRRIDHWVQLDVSALKVDRPVLVNILKIGLPTGIQSAVFALSNIVIQSAINSLGAVAMAASSAAFHLEMIAYAVMNSFSQACATFVSQNYGAGQLLRYRKTFGLCLLEGAMASATAIVVVLFTGRFLLSLFNNDPAVIDMGYIRLLTVFFAYLFSMLYEVMSGYLRGFGISMVPSLLTIVGVCVVRIAWIQFVFPIHQTFQTIMTAYPVSLSTTAVLISLALLHYRPVKTMLQTTYTQNVCQDVN